MKPDFHFADLHCHPNLKTFGHSFTNRKNNRKQDVWYAEKPSAFRKLVKIATGITRFSQTDFSTMAKGGTKLAFVSLYPFEKGFFINAAGKGLLSAVLSDWVTGISYKRIRHLQRHTDYFEDLCLEYAFMLAGKQTHRIGQDEYSWKPVADWPELASVLETPNQIAVVFSIEGAHVFNTGLEAYGRKTDPEEVIRNVKTVKNWQFPPVFITFAHNFNNDLCGHARSLDPLEFIVNQRKNLDADFSPLGEEVLDLLLDKRSGKRILIDLKHMSITARKSYYNYLKVHDQASSIPLVVSHGAVAGVRFDGTPSLKYESPMFYVSDINFFDEEIVNIHLSGGLFAIQLDCRRIAGKMALSQISRNIFHKELTKQSAQIVWNQIRHVAELLDKHHHFAWGTACIGSDFDGTINPLNGLLTVEDFRIMASELVELANKYLKGPNRLGLAENRQIIPEDLVERFCIGNVTRFMEKHYICTG